MVFLKIFTNVFYNWETQGQLIGNFNYAIPKKKKEKIEKKNASWMQDKRH